MAPKDASNVERPGDDDVLQAVVLADSFNKRFKPLTSRRPRCLIPVCNAPLLDWTFESLALAGVQEIFVICRSHAEQVKNKILESRWSKPGSGIKIVPIITAKETFSPGDALRDVYTRGLVTNDFVLVNGDLVSSVRIEDAVKVHKERRKQNKDVIMTIVLKESGGKHRTRSRGESGLFAINPETSECIHYEHIVGYPPKRSLSIPRESLAKHSLIEIRNDLIDCGIDICSVEVPSLFQDNFDYSDIRRDFVYGVLTSDLLMKSIHCHIAPDGYAARVKDTRSYDAVSKDILSRWTFPLVPDDNHPGGHIYEHLPGNQYIAKGNSVHLARQSKVGRNTLLGAGTQVCDNAQVNFSVVGQNCIIGTGSLVHKSYIFDGTVIGSNCTIEQSILGVGVVIKDRTRIGKGCLIGDGVILGPDATLAPFDKASKRPTPDDADGSDSDSEEELVASQPSSSTLGQDSNAILWRQATEENDDVVENFNNQRLMRLADTISDLDLSGDDSDSSEDGEDASSAADMSVGSSTLDPSQSEFATEVKLSLARAFSEGHSVDNAAVELKTLRMASNVPLSRVREAVIAAIVDHVRVTDGVPMGQEVSKVVRRWGQLVNKIGGVDGVETIGDLQRYCSLAQRSQLFGHVVLAFYNEDLVEEDDIRTWHAKNRAAGREDEDMKRGLAVTVRLIQQFDEQDSEEVSE